MSLTPDSPGRIAGVQRLDKWLWFARVAKTRTLAAGLVVGGKVRVNKAKTDKPSLSVRIGDVLTITTRAKVRILRIMAPGERGGPPASAQQLYEDITPKALMPGDAAGGGSVERATQAPIREDGGRPTKRDRRALERLTRDEQ